MTRHGWTRAALAALALLPAGCFYEAPRHSVPPIFVLQLSEQRYTDALEALGECSPGYAHRQELDALMATLEDRKASYERTVAEMIDGKTDFAPEETAYFAELKPDMANALHHAIECGVLPPDVLDQPTGDAEWWDFSSDDGGGYTPPYTPPTP